MKSKKAIIFGIKGTKLSISEISLLKNFNPWGIILFDRNIKNIYQVKKLTNQIRSVTKNKKYPIIIDQEGGKVSRLKNIINLEHFDQHTFGNLYKRNKKNFNFVYQKYIDMTSFFLNDMGININTVPVLDIMRKNTHKVIGNRSFSNNKRIVNELGQLCIKFYKKNNIATVMKNIPGHGLADKDTHHSMPIVQATKKKLFNNDFYPFKKNKPFFAMTAHVLFKSFDLKNTVTHSKILITNVIRKKLGFKGILISDDISMKSLNLTLEKNAIMAIQSGCNLVLHCNGNIKEMKRLIKVIPNIDNFTRKKTSDFYKFLR